MISAWPDLTAWRAHLPLSLPFEAQALRVPNHRYQDFVQLFSGVFLPDVLSQAVPKRKALFLAGRWCAHQCFRRLGKAVDIIPKGEDGAPLWPKGYLGSISHSSNFALAAVVPQSDVKGLGLDVEHWMKAETALRVGPRIASQAEQNLFERLNHFDIQQYYTLVFSGKESFYKAIYPQVKQFLDFDVVEFEAVDFQTGRFDLRCKQPLGTLHKDQLVSGMFKYDIEQIFTGVILR